jgi:hypothetical protein
MFLSTIGSVIGIASSVNSLFGGGGEGGSAQQATQAADPFSGYRSQLGQMYSSALQPGASANLQSMPGYTQYNTGVMQPALQASQRQAAGAGMLYSGNEQQALQKTAQQGYYGFMQDYMNRLAQGSGAVNNPAQGAALGIDQGNLNDKAFSQGLGSLAQQFSPGGAVSNLYNSFGGGSGGYQTYPSSPGYVQEDFGGI